MIDGLIETFVAVFGNYVQFLPGLILQLTQRAEPGRGVGRSFTLAQCIIIGGDLGLVSTIHSLAGHFYITSVKIGNPESKYSISNDGLLSKFMMSSAINTFKTK